jgi:hypothetical protein
MGFDGFENGGVDMEWRRLHAIKQSAKDKVHIVGRSLTTCRYVPFGLATHFVPPVI